jgi:hypothetical protein
MLEKLNGAGLYAVCGGIVFVVAVICVIFLVRAWRAGLAIGMDKKKMRLAVTSSATFSILPSVGILLGVIALSGSLGIPLPWLRLSVIGALHYETQVAEAAAEAVGLPGLSASAMTAQAFSTIALVMGVCIMWGMVLSVIFTPRYTKKLSGRPSAGKTAGGGFAGKVIKVVFIGLVAVCIGSCLGNLAAGEGLFTFRVAWPTVIGALLSGAVVTGLTGLIEKKKKAGGKPKPSAVRMIGGGFADEAMTAMFIGLVSAYIGSYIGGLVSGNARLDLAGDPVPLCCALAAAAGMMLFTRLSDLKGLKWLEDFSLALAMLAGMAAAILFRMLFPAAGGGTDAAAESACLMMMGGALL